MQPFLKWAGGKRWLFTEDFVNSLPQKINRYIEPFLGGGAGFFALEPKKALLSDISPELINLYQVVRDSPKRLQEYLRHHQEEHCHDYYYTIRQSKFTERVQRAAQFLYLNRTCWNGLYRLNRLGEFNVPIGTKTIVCLPSDNFLQASKLLRAAEIVCQDFEDPINMATDGDLLFVDPPYTVKHNMNGFIKYNENIFSWTDQVRLKDALVRASKRGAMVILTNADHASIRELYDGFGSHVTVERHSVISGKRSGRASITELMVRA